MVYTIPNATEPMELIADVSTQIPILFPSLLLMIFITIAGAGYYSQQRRLGRSNFAIWAATSALITTTGAFVLFLNEGIIGLETLIICVVLTIFCAMWAFFSKEDGGI